MVEAYRPLKQIVWFKVTAIMIFTKSILVEVVVIDCDHSPVRSVIAKI